MRATSLADAPGAVLSSDRRSRPRMAKADLRIPESVNAAWLLLGQAMNRTRQACRLSVKEFADQVQRDEAQVRRWFAGKERPQADAVFAVVAFQKAFVIALAEDVAGIETTTEIRVSRSA
jgi:DNA-binding transcriptional regulator YiaG